MSVSRPHPSTFIAATRGRGATEGGEQSLWLSGMALAAHMTSVGPRVAHRQPRRMRHVARACWRSEAMDAFNVRRML
jgi:hypothetical protein